MGKGGMVMASPIIRLLFWIVVAGGLIAAGCRGANIAQLAFSFGIAVALIGCILFVCHLITK